MPATKTALETVTAIHSALAAVGLGRTSRMNGGEIVGWTTARGSTGFSVRETDDGLLYWHVVISGKPHMRYREYRSDDHDLHDPVNPEILEPRIRHVFETQDLDVQSVCCCGHQSHWDDDVDYAIVTTRPPWLEAKPPATSRRSSW